MLSGDNSVHDLGIACVSGECNTKPFLSHFKPVRRRIDSQVDRLFTRRKHPRLISSRSDPQNRIADTLPVRRAPGVDVYGYNEEVVFRIGGRNRIAKYSLST